MAGQVMTEYLIAGIVLSVVLFMAHQVVLSALHYQSRYETQLALMPPQSPPTLADAEPFEVSGWQTHSDIVAEEPDWASQPGAARPPELGPSPVDLPLTPGAEGDGSYRWQVAVAQSTRHYRFELIYENAGSEPHPMHLTVNGAVVHTYQMAPYQPPVNQSGADPAAVWPHEQSVLVALPPGTHDIRLVPASGGISDTVTPQRLQYWREDIRPPGELGNGIEDAFDFL